MFSPEFGEMLDSSTGMKVSEVLRWLSSYTTTRCDPHRRDTLALSGEWPQYEELHVTSVSSTNMASDVVTKEPVLLQVALLLK